MRGRGAGTTYRSIIYSLRFASVGDRHKMPAYRGVRVMKRFVVFAALIASPAFAAGPTPQSAAKASMRISPAAESPPKPARSPMS